LPEDRKNRARKKITEARRVGTFGKLSVKAQRWSSEAATGGRANTLTIFFEMRSNFFKNEHMRPWCSSNARVYVVFIHAIYIGI